MESAMEITGKATIWLGPFLLLGIQIGCASLSPGEPVRHCIPTRDVAHAAGPVSEVQAASYQEARSSLPPADQGAADSSPQPPTFAALSELSLEALIEEVLARNPSL